MSKRPVILIVDDDEGMRDSLCELLGRDGYHLMTANDGYQALEQIQRTDVDLILLDIMMPGIDGIETLKRIRAIDERPQVIMITGYGTIESAVKAMKFGAKDYVTKPFVVRNLRKAIKESLDFTISVFNNLQMTANTNPGGLIGEGAIMKRLFDLLAKVIQNEATVLILGESGTGKELVARAIHKEGPRKDKPFVGINCAAIPDSLLESELFGYEKGAFTGALNRKIGKFEQANGGTIFLDEIGDMNIATQAKILRVLEEREVVRIGGMEPVKVNARVIAATNKDLQEGVANGTFREDLYYRLNVVPITLPPLRERKEDIPLLIKHFLLKYSEDYNKPVKTISAPLVDLLKNYHWPGNVRELRNIVERIVVLGEKDFHPEEHLKLPGSANEKESGFEVPSLKAVRTKFTDAKEREIIRDALERTRWNKKRAAEMLEISRKSLYEKMAKYGLE
ncbi:MAG: sigma-54-dependent transcriptional regulator [Bacillota bacterium]